MQTVEELLLQAQQKQYTYIQRIDILIRGNGLIKFRIIIAQTLFVQVNRNENTSLTNFALIHNAKRIYGRDEFQGEWHQHPVSEPNLHRQDIEGLRPTSLSTFLTEVDTILQEKHLI